MNQNHGGKVPREPWMTDELAVRLRKVARENEITCEQAQQFARENNIEITKMKSLVDSVGITLSNCRGLCK